jgi:hypothetical protein
MVETTEPRHYFRSMDDDEDSAPRCGDGDAQLGVRVPIDIKPNDDGNVHPETGGMSAAADHPKHLPPHFRPRALPGGRSTLPVFQIVDQQLGAELRVRLKRKHALIEPARTMSLADYQGTLCGTRLNWRRWHE